MLSVRFQCYQTVPILAFNLVDFPINILYTPLKLYLDIISDIIIIRVVDYRLNASHFNLNDIEI